MNKNSIRQKVIDLKNKLNILIVAHYYQKDEVFEVADIVGDSLELAKKSSNNDAKNIVFCGVSFMGQTVKVLAPNKKIFMPKIACCSMARMISRDLLANCIDILKDNGIEKTDVFPITYINSYIGVKAEVGKMGGSVCTSSNADKIILKALEEDKKILFIPDKCLGQNIAKKLGLKSAVIGLDKNLKEADILCFNGYCSVHQNFSLEDIDYYRKTYKDILIVSHPECEPIICDKSDFVGSTSQIINFVNNLDEEQKVAVATEDNLVSRLRKKNTYNLSRKIKPECPTMNETSLEDLYDVLLSVEEGNGKNEINVDIYNARFARLALNRMFEV